MKKEINNPHDKIFKTMLADRDVAIDFLRNFLPENVKNFIDIDNFQYANTSFVSEELKETFKDIVLKCPMKNSDKEVFVTIILEHKSQPDKYAAVQILYYLASSYFRQLHEEKKIELIIPLIFYHGKKKWVLKSISELIPFLPSELQSFVPVFDTIFVDTNRFDKNQLANINNAFLLATLIAQIKDQDPEAIFIKSLTILSKSNADENWNLLNATFVYLMETTKFSDDKIHELLEKIPKPIKTKIMTTYDVILRKGKIEGKIEGKKEGKIEGKKEGIEEGIELKEIDVIIKGYKKGASIDFLAEITGLNIEKVREIIENDLKG